jgi:hypothetical protein
MFGLFQLPIAGTGNPRLDAIAQASALGIALAGVLVKTFGKKKVVKQPAKRVAKSLPANMRAPESQDEIDDANARR